MRKIAVTVTLAFLMRGAAFAQEPIYLGLGFNHTLRNGRFYAYSPVLLQTNSPVGANQVLVAAWKAANTAGYPNALAAAVAMGPAQTVYPSNANQVLTSVWNHSNNALNIYCNNCGSATSVPWSGITASTGNTTIPQGGFTTLFSNSGNWTWKGTGGANVTALNLQRSGDTGYRTQISGARIDFSNVGDGSSDMYLREASTNTMEMNKSLSLLTSMTLGTSMDVTEIASPGNPGAGKDRVYADSTSHLLTCLTSSGGNCFGGGVAWSAITAPTGDLTLDFATHNTTFTNGGTLSYTSTQGNASSFSSVAATSSIAISASAQTTAANAEGISSNSDITSTADPDTSFGYAVAGLATVHGSGHFTGTNTGSPLVGGYFAVGTNNTAHVDEADSVIIDSPCPCGSAPIATAYGLRINDQNASTTNYAIYSGKGKVDLFNNLSDESGQLNVENDVATASVSTPNGINGQAFLMSDQAITSLSGVHGYAENHAMSNLNILSSAIFDAPGNTGGGTPVRVFGIYVEGDIAGKGSTASAALEIDNQTSTTKAIETGTGAVHFGTLSASSIVQTNSSTNLVSSNTLPAGTLPGFLYSGGFAGRATAVTDTTMVTPVADTMYRFSATINCTTTSAAAVATLNLKYKDTGGASQVTTISDTCTALVTTGVPNEVVMIRAQSGTAVTWGVSITNTPTYDVFVRLEAM